jgi:hypothetical protein
MSYNKKVWKSGDRITKEALNNMENGIEAAHQNSGGGGTSYDDTEIKTDINNIKTDLGTAQLTTTAKDVKGAVNEVNAQYKDIANYGLTIGEDGKAYLMNEKGVKFGTGIEFPSDVDLTTLKLTVDGQTLKLMNGSTELANVTLPSTTVTDKQLSTVIQSKIDDGTLTSLVLGDNSVSSSNIQDGAITFTKLNGVSVEKFDYIEYQNCKITNTTGEIVSSTGKHVTRAYPVSPGNFIYMYGYFWNYNDCQGAYYDKDNKFLSTFQGGIVSHKHYYGKAPENAYFVRFTILDENKDIICFGNPLKNYPKNLCLNSELNKAISSMIGEIGLPSKSVDAKALNIIRKKSYNKIDYSTLVNFYPLANNVYKGKWKGSAKCYLEKGVSYKTITNITDLWYFVFFKDNKIVGSSKGNSDIFGSYTDDIVNYIHHYTFTLPNNLDFDDFIFVLAPTQAISDIKVVISEESEFGLYDDDYAEYSFTDDDLTNTIKYIMNKKEVNGLDGNICIAMGDSYTVQMATPLKNMIKKYGMTIDNRGIVSSSICGDEAGNKGYQPMWKRTKNICEEYTTNGTADNVKLILFMGGANDGFGINTWIGTGINDTNNEHIYGAMHTILNSFRKTFKNAKIIVVLQPSSYNRTVSSITDDSTAKLLGFSGLTELQLLDDYQFSNYSMFVKEKAVKEVAEFYNCKIVDCCFDWHSVLNENDRVNYWKSDKLHLTNLGYQDVVNAEEKAIIEIFG